MINVITGVGNNAFDTLSYPTQNPANLQFIQTNLQNFSQTLNDVGRNFMESARQVYDQINNSEAAHLARVAIRAARGMFSSNHIAPLMTLDELQAAQPTMQRWIMADVTIRELFQKQRCSGYADTYVDVHPGEIGESHYDWRRVMDGVGVIPDDDQPSYFKFYMDELLEGDRTLQACEKNDILDTWDVVKLFVAGGEDPTDPFGGKL